MERKDLMVSMVRSISDRLNAIAPFSATCLTLINESLDADKTKDAIDNIFSEKAATNYTTLLTRIHNLTEDENKYELDNALIYLEGMADPAHETLVKPLIYFKKNECLVMTTSLLFEKCNTTAGIEDNVFIAIENIYLSVKDDPVSLNSFLSNIENKNDYGYIVLTNNNANDAWNLYGYACLCHINEEKFEIPVELTYPANTKFHNSAIVYDSDVPYIQYFDVFNVMNESKHTQDVLGRYLRMYQILEYFAFRIHLVTIANVSIRNSAFVRTTIKEAHRSVNNEEDEFLKMFVQLFPGVTSVGKLDDSSITPYNNFLDKNYGIKVGDPHCVRKVGRILYKLRNSIVHNKATELHFTYGNVDEYRDGIGLIRLVTNKMEEEIVKLLNDPNRNELKLARSTMPLY